MAQAGGEHERALKRPRLNEPEPEQTATCLICTDDEAVSEGVFCKGADGHFTCKSCFGGQIADLCTAPYRTFEAEVGRCRLTPS